MAPRYIFPAHAGGRTVEVATTCGSKQRRKAYPVIRVAAQAAFELLNMVCTSLQAAATNSSSSADKEAAQKAAGETAQRPLIVAVAEAVWGMISVTALHRSDSGAPQEQPADPESDFTALARKHNASASFAAMAACRFTGIVVQHLLCSVQSKGLGRDGRPSPCKASVISPVVAALLDSQLLAAAATTVVASPDPYAAGGLTDAGRSQFCYQMHPASESLAQSLVHLRMLQEALKENGGREGRRLAVDLLRATRHDAVQRLQVALLDQLAAHAGMGAGLEEWEQQQGEEGRQQRQPAETGRQQQQQQEEREEEVQQQQVRQAVEQVAGGWAGSSGSWWLAKAEACEGKLLVAREGNERRQGERSRGWTAGWLENYHCLIVTASLGDWKFAESPEAAAAGVPARPPPLLLARLAARATEALCRLCRGQGLGGAYAPAPEWTFCRFWVLAMDLVPKPSDRASLPADTVQACLPYWLETAAWAVALLSDGTAAVMGRLPATQREGPPRSAIEDAYTKGGTAAATLHRVIDFLTDAGNDGVTTLPAAATADINRRLLRRGLASSVDHTLRLAWSSAVGELCHADLQAAAIFAIPLVHLAPLPGPTPAPSDGTGGSLVGLSCGAGSSSSSCARGFGGGAEAGDQLGLLLTLSKRAGMLTRALEAAAGAGAGAGAGGQAASQSVGQGLQLVELAKHGLWSLLYALMKAQGAMRARMEAAAGTAEELNCRRAGEATDEGAVWAPGAACVDEAHEAVALAARAVCSLAAPLAWRVAADVAAGAVGDSPEVPVDAAAGAADGSGVLDTEGVLLAGGMQELLQSAVQWWRPPLLLPPAQLLACQPQRLLAAACALAGVLPEGHKARRQQLVLWAIQLTVAMAAHKTLSGRVRSWSAGPQLAAQGCVTEGPEGGSPADTCAGAGCLVAPVQFAVQHAMNFAPRRAAQAIALLKIAAGEVAAGEVAAGEITAGEVAAGEVAAREVAEGEVAAQGPGGGVGGGDGGGADAARVDTDGGFQRYAAAVAEHLETAEDASGPKAEEPLLPDGRKALALAVELLAANGQIEQFDKDGHLPPPPPPSAPSWPLPPPLALPPGWAGALPRLRVCGNPACCNFAKEREGALPFKQCGGCRAVRYCGADCQRAHWREGHRAECKVLAEAGVR